jgi:hypothetical protein
MFQSLVTDYYMIKERKGRDEKIRGKGKWRRKKEKGKMQVQSTHTKCGGDQRGQQ